MRQSDPCKANLKQLSVRFLMMGRGAARAGFLGPGRITLGAHFGRVAEGGWGSAVGARSIIKNQLESTSTTILHINLQRL